MHFPHREIDANRIGFAVDVIEANYSLNASIQETDGALQQFQENQNLHGGIRIANSQNNHAGTLGGFVRDRYSGTNMILSTWHVLAGSWNTQQGIPVCLPADSTERRNQPEFVAEYTRSAIAHHFDAAVACLKNQYNCHNNQSGIGPVNGVTAPRLGMKVMKSGAGTNVTSGIITGISGCLVQNYYGRQYSIRSVIHILPLQRNTEMCASGDSGAWWLEQSTSYAVGLHIAGNSDASSSLAVNMQDVLDVLEVDVITERSGPSWLPKATTLSDKSKTENNYQSIRSTPEENEASPMSPAIIKYQHPGQFVPVNFQSIPEHTAKRNYRKIVFTKIVLLLHQNIRSIVRSFIYLFFLLMSYFTVSNFNSNNEPKPDQLLNQINHLHEVAQQISAIRQIDALRDRRIKKIVSIIDKYNERMAPELKVSIASEIFEMTIRYENLDIELICATITHESALTWNPEIVSPVGAMGLMQILPTTGSYLARQEGILDYQAKEILFNPNYNIRLGCRYLSNLIEVYSIDGGLAAYNGGMKRAEKWVRSGRADGILHEETALYVPSILKFYEMFKCM
ncbi:MAG: transglycosylase SLT domain-containing protein [Candidatus Zhuqueibacterota bacterium]